MRHIKYPLISSIYHYRHNKKTMGNGEYGLLLDIRRQIMVGLFCLLFNSHRRIENNQCFLLYYEENVMGSEYTVHDTVKFLSWSFTKATMRAVSVLGNRAVRPSHPAESRERWKLYEYQVEFSYILDEITRGSKYISTKNIHLANELIGEINNLVK